MGILSVSIIVVINFILQTTLLQHFRIFGIAPNTTLILVVVFSIIWGKKRGALIGLVSGILQDIVVGRLLGANALIYMLIGFTVGSFENKIFKDNRITPVFFTVLATIAYHILYYVIMYMTQNKIDFILLLTKIVFVEIIYNTVLASVIYYKLFNTIYHSKLKIKIR